MNKNRFRIIFNQIRGLMMVVAENVKSHTTQAESTKHSQTDISGSDTVANHLTLIATQGDIQAQNATINTNQTLTANTTQTLITDGATVSANQLNLIAHDLSNIGGTLMQTGVGDTIISLAGNLNNTQGSIASNSNNLTLAAQTIFNTDASIEHAGSGQLTIRTTTLDGVTKAPVRSWIHVILAIYRKMPQAHNRPASPSIAATPKIAIPKYRKSPLSPSPVPAL